MAGSRKAGDERFNPQPIKDPSLRGAVVMGQYRRGPDDLTFSVIMTFPDGSKQVVSAGRRDREEAAFFASRTYIERLTRIQAGLPAKASTAPVMAQKPKLPCFVDAADIAITRLTERYADTLKREGAAKAVKFNALRASIRRVLLPTFEITPWEKMQSKALAWLPTYRLENGKRPSQNTVGNVNHALQYVNTIAVEQGWLAAEQHLHPKLSKAKFDPPVHAPAFSYEEMQWLASNIDAAWAGSDEKMIFRMWVAVMASAGTRAGLETYSLKESQFTISDKGIFIHVTAHAGKYKRARRAVCAGDVFAMKAMLNDYLEWRRDSWTCDKDMDASSIFTHPHKGYIPQVNRMFSGVLEDCGLLIDPDTQQERVPYSCRHFYATQQLLSGTPIAIVAAVMGTSVKMIEDHYSHVKGMDAALRVNGITDTLDMVDGFVATKNPPLRKGALRAV